MPDFEKATAFNMNNGPFIDKVTITTHTYDVKDIYPLPDTTGGCSYPREDPLVIED